MSVGNTCSDRAADGERSPQDAPPAEEGAKVSHLLQPRRSPGASPEIDSRDAAKHLDTANDTGIPRAVVAVRGTVRCPR